MKNKYNKMIITVSMATAIAFVIIISRAAISHAWFKNVDDDIGNSAMGAVSVGISNAEKVEDKVLMFEITNTSTIDTYIRLGWTPVYRKEGEDLTKDTRGIGASANNTSELNGLNFSAQTVETLNRYQKNMFILTDDLGNYFVIPAGTNVSGRINVGNYNLKEDESLHLILVPEAIQATWKAVEAASDYGWTTSKVGGSTGNNGQAGTIAGPVYTGSP